MRTPLSYFALCLLIGSCSPSSSDRPPVAPIRGAKLQPESRAPIPRPERSAPVTQQDNSAPIQRQERTYSTRSIVSFDQENGQPAWIDEARQRVQGATWTFRPDGTFTFAPANSRTDLFPVHGLYRCASLRCNLSGDSSSRIGSTGSASVAIEGIIDFGQEPPLLNMSQVTSAGNAAVVNDIRFSQATGVTYRFSVTLE
jgi:hypothetical protein